MRTTKYPISYKNSDVLKALNGQDLLIKRSFYALGVETG
jgi:hypothetical protein